MSGESEESDDYCKIIDNILLAENIAEEAAYEEGYIIGKNQMVEGFHFGYHRASSLAAQLGYYFGVLIFIQKSCTVPKIIDLSKKLIQKIKDFPMDNDDSIDIFQEFEKIKLNFKKICSLAKVNTTHSEISKFDF